MAEGMVTLKLRPGDQQKLQMALKGLVQKANINTPVVLAQAGARGVDYCKKNCPVDTDRLRASIGVPGKGGVFRLGASGILGGATGVMFGTAVEYALHVEFGHKTRLKNPKPGKKSFVKGRHYMLRGVQQAVPEMIDILKGVLR